MSTPENISSIPIDDVHHLCWSCKEEVGPGPFCKHCVKIQCVDDLSDYFRLFNLEKSYSINEELLKKRFYDLSRQFHPDFYSIRSEAEKSIARDNTAYLNTALKVLMDPIKRADYLLSIMVGNTPGNPTPPRELLDEILEIGEILLGESLNENQRSQLMETLKRFRELKNKLVQSLHPLFDRLLQNETKVADQIESSLNNIKYLRTIIGRIEAALNHMENRK
ncbi:MAG: Fe-S protein assembly co-chaperone HscB [candidate division Zixibacteria bacterium]